MAVTSAPRRPDQKLRIRRAAARLFAERGYAATGVEELSQAVGLGRGALYHHITSKQQLLYDVMTPGVIEVVTEAEALLEEPLGAEATIRRLSAMTMQAVAQNLDEWTVFFRETAALDGELRREAFAWRDRFEDVWTAAIERGVTDGEFRRLDPIVIKGILGMHNHAHVWLRPRGRLRPEAIAEKFCDLVLSGLRA
ncbi:MAG: TetR/AcrR family transcriptional regulator [Solirubrobacterales bacterium]|nr:TetR/AcrR family transcriptional regulator [Solirubrobacterales bacterium]